MKVLGIQQQQMVEDSMQSLTSGTDETTVFSSQQSPLASQNPLPAKKKNGRRSLTGNSAPEAEVIALSPKTLMATNRFVCEICNKGFRRDQNLQLHRRRHNLPWKLKQKTGKQVRKKVYICPEVSCVHHDPCRALGDLTGIKKHFSRKHGEKKWKCDKCSKKYAVQCDWKAHCKICGTREYRCGCGTLFIRRDSFVTHRAFCDALAEESARVATANFVDNQHRLLFPQPEHSTLPPTTAQNKISDFMRTAEVITTTTGDDGHLDFSIKGEEQHQHLNMKPWQPSRNHMGVFPYICPYKNQSPYLSSHKTSANSPHLSATALLQKAAQTGATMSRTQHKAQMEAHSSTATGFGLGWPSHRDMSCSGGNSVHGLIPPVTFLQDMVSLPSATGLGGSCERLFNGMLGSKREETSGVDSLKRSHGRNEGGRGVCVRDGFARGFLSDGQFCDREMLKMAGMDSTMNSFFL